MDPSFEGEPGCALAVPIPAANELVGAKTVNAVGRHAEDQRGPQWRRFRGEGKNSCKRACGRSKTLAEAEGLKCLLQPQLCTGEIVN